MHPGGQGEIVCDGNDGLAMDRDEIPKNSEDLLRGYRIKTSSRLVGKNDGWIIRQGPRDGYTLALSPRQLIGRLVTMVAKAK